MYGNTYQYSGYNNMFNNPTQQYSPQFGQKQEVLRVNGQNGAMALNLPPNSSALALDMNAPILWLVTSDGAGYKTAEPYDISPHQQTAVADFSSLENRISRLEELINAQPDTTAVAETSAAK